MQIPVEKRFPKAIIFDMDGVLVDSEPYHIEVEKRMFQKVGVDVSDEEHASYMGTATDVMWRQIIEKEAAFARCGGNDTTYQSRRDSFFCPGKTGANAGPEKIARLP